MTRKQTNQQMQFHVKFIYLILPRGFGVLGFWGFGVVLMADLHPQSRLPTVEPPQTRYPSVSALGYGAFFGAIVLPCQPGFISFFFARALLFESPVNSLANFGAFGVGMAAPLLGLAVISEPWRDQVLNTLTSHRHAVNAIAGTALLAISLYYLLFEFEIVPIPGI
jgi:cytochrome c-type biogenesis protein